MHRWNLKPWYLGDENTRRREAKFSTEPWAVPTFKSPEGGGGSSKGEQERSGGEEVEQNVPYLANNLNA